MDNKLQEDIYEQIVGLREIAECLVNDYEFVSEEDRQLNRIKIMKYKLDKLYDMLKKE